MKIKVWNNKNNTIDIDPTTGRIIKQKDPTSKTLKAVIYCRVSTGRQVTEWHWLETQESYCRDWCKNHWVEVVKVIKDEWISGTKLNRAWILETIAFIEEQNKKQKTITHFVCTEESRLSRSEDLWATLELESKILSTGVQIVFSFGNISTGTDDGDFLTKIKYIVASDERKKINKRMMSSKIDRAKMGHRPMPCVPVWYEKIQEKGQKRIEIDPIKWPLMKKGLEMFANNILNSHDDLFHYWKKDWLTTSDKKWKLYYSFVWKTFNIQRLYFYAGMIIVPKRWIDEPIEAMHPPLITFDTFLKLVQKIWGNKTKNRKTKSIPDDSFILRGCIKCPECEYSYTTRHSKNARWILYPYYWCSNKLCKKRANLPQQKVETEFFQLLQSITIPNEVIQLFEAIVEENRKEKKTYEKKERQLKFNRISAIEKRMQEIEISIWKMKNEKLIEKMEEERADLEAEQRVLQEQLDNPSYNEEALFNLLGKIKGIFTNPLAFWELWNTDMRQLLVNVRFGWNLYYSKEKWYRTTKKAGLDQLFHAIWCGSKPSLQGGETRTHDHKTPSLVF